MSDDTEVLVGDGTIRVVENARQKNKVIELRVDARAAVTRYRAARWCRAMERDVPQPLRWPRRVTCDNLVGQEEAGADRYATLRAEEVVHPTNGGGCRATGSGAQEVRGDLPMRILRVREGIAAAGFLVMVGAIVAAIVWLTAQ